MKSLNFASPDGDHRQDITTQSDTKYQHSSKHITDMKTLLIIGLSLAMAVIILFASIRIIQWLVTGICWVLSVAIDIFRESRASAEKVNVRLQELTDYITAEYNRAKHRANQICRRSLCSLSPRICTMLTFMSWMLSKASNAMYIRYHNTADRSLELPSCRWKR